MKPPFDAFARRSPHALLALTVVWPLVCQAAPVAGAPRAAPKPVAGAPAPAASAATPDYLLGPDDVISVVVARHPEISLDEATIPSSGKISIPQVGEIFVAGKTIAQTQTLVVKALGKLLKRPEATVVLRTQRPRRVLVLGAAVTNAGVQNANIGWRVLDALAAAGGIKAGLSPELVEGILTHANGTQITLDLPGIIANRAPNPVIQPNDRLVFSPRTISITVAGQVQKPAVYDLSPDGGLAELLAQAGGVLAKAALTQVSIKHVDGTVVPVDLRNNPDANPQLKNGDLVVVPELRAHVTLSGEVSKPGVYDLEDGRNTRVADIVAQAGGLGVPLDQARLTLTRTSNVTVNTPDGAGGTETNIVRRPVTRDTLVQDGDIIEVTATHVNVTIAGQIKAGGAFELRPNDGLAELIAKAGGPADDAALTRVVVQRNGKPLPVDAYDAVREGKPLDFLLQDGDYVVVPQNRTKIYVMGAVGKQGYQTVPEREPLTLGEALTIAGGPDQAAKTKEIGLIRQTPQGERRDVVDLNKNYNGRLALNLPLQYGDVIYVPQGKPKTSILSRFLSILPIAGLFAL